MPVGAEIVTREGITVTSPERSIVDAATAGTAPEQIEAAVIEALEAGLTTEDRLRSTAMRSSRRVAALIERAINLEQSLRYATSEAFRGALDQRLKNHADETGSGLTRLRKAVAFDRPAS